MRGRKVMIIKWPIRGRDRGFTLIECLVMVAIIGLLAALVVPAVAAARESSRRAQCANQLRQVGMALASHHSVHGKFPAGALPNGCSRSGKKLGLGPLSAHAQLLPFLEQGGLYNHLNVALNDPSSVPQLSSSGDPANGTVLATVLAVFLCPSDNGGPLPGNDYRVCIGPNPYEADGTSWPGGGGAFPGLDATSAADFRDGLSQTVGFGERLLGSGLGRAFDPRHDYWFSELERLGEPDSPDAMAAACAALSSVPSSAFLEAGRSWLSGGYEDTLYNHVGPPNWDRPDCSVGSPTDGRPGALSGGAFSARSGHPGGVHVALMDGSIRFAKQGVHLGVWRALATRSGDDVASGDEY